MPAFKPPAEDNPLSERKKLVIGLLAQGLLHREIARQTGLSTSMIDKHAEDITHLLHATSPFQAGVEAHRRGWVA